jgi:hypothetical protein
MSSTLIAPIHDANCPLSPLYRAVISPYQQAGSGHLAPTNCICNARRVAAYATASHGVFSAPTSAPVPSPIYPRQMHGYLPPSQSLIPHSSLPRPYDTTQTSLSSNAFNFSADKRPRTPIPPREHSNTPANAVLVHKGNRRSSNVRHVFPSSSYQESASTVAIQGISQPALTPVTVGTHQPLAREVRPLQSSMYMAPGQDRR